MAEILFYHLERQPLDRVLPRLLHKTLERGWRATVKASSAERVEALAAQLWIHSEDGFLPHGTRQDGFAELQPIWITEDDDIPNGSNVLFLVDGATADPLPALERIVFMFDGHAQESVERARNDWKTAQGAGHAVSYWQQDEDGRWINRAAKELKSAES